MSSSLSRDIVTLNLETQLSRDKWKPSDVNDSEDHLDMYDKGQVRIGMVGIDIKSKGRGYWSKN